MAGGFVVASLLHSCFSRQRSRAAVQLSRRYHATSVCGGTLCLPAIWLRVPWPSTHSLRHCSRRASGWCLWLAFSATVAHSADMLEAYAFSTLTQLAAGFLNPQASLQEPTVLQRGGRTGSGREWGLAKCCNTAWPLGGFEDYEKPLPVKVDVDDRAGHGLAGAYLPTAATVQGKRMLTTARRRPPRWPSCPGGLATVDESHQKAPQIIP